MGWSDILSFLQTWGPVGGPALGVLIFILWKDFRREDRLQTRIENLEKEQKDVILPMVEKYAELTTRSTDVMARLELVLSRCLRCEYPEAMKLAEKLLKANEST
jgi:hypothetical protein